MIKTIRFPIKGTFYHDAKQALQSGKLLSDSLLNLQADSDNAYDPYAIQVWIKHDSYLLGYVPKTLSKSLLSHLAYKHDCVLTSVQQKGQYISLIAQIDINTSALQALKIFWISTYICWSYRLKSFIKTFI